MEHNEEEDGGDEEGDGEDEEEGGQQPLQLLFQYFSLDVELRFDVVIVVVAPEVVK